MYSIKEIHIELSDFCILSCKHCSSLASKNGKRILGINELTSILTEGKEMGACSVMVSGGEPLLHPNFFSFLEICSKLDYQIKIYSSGILGDGNRAGSIGRGMLKRISAYENIISIVFSLHGSNAKTHDYITTLTGSFELTVESIMKANDEGIKTEIHTVPMSINYKEIPGIIKLAETLSVEQVSLLRLVPQGRCLQNKHLLMNQDETREFVNIVNEHNWQNVRKGTPFKCLFFNRDNVCSAGKDKVLIGPDGSVLPCEAFKAEITRTTIRQKSLQEIWVTDPLIKQVRNLHADKISFCNSCPYLNTCNGGCPGQRRLRDNSMLVGPDPVCIYQG